MITLGVDGYVTREQFEAWATARLLDYTPYNSLQIEAAIRVACIDFIDVNYQFAGCPASDAQVMSLPTTYVSIDDVQNAVCTAVWAQLTGILFVADSVQTTGEVISESSKLGDLSKSVTYAEGTRRTYTQSTTKIDRLMKPFTIGGTGGLGLMRG